jgi:CubicO group peptidase (beta-lactamase class C family)
MTPLADEKEMEMGAFLQNTAVAATSKDSMLQIVAWHDRTQADHKLQLDQHQVDTLEAQSFNTLSLSLYNTPQDPRYACVLIKRPQKVAEQQVYGLTAEQLWQTLDQMSANGMGAHIVTATGPAGSAVFAASFIPVTPTPFTLIDLVPGDFRAMNQQATTGGLKLMWFDCYGTPDDPRYIAVWWPNHEMLAWSCDGVGEDVTHMQQRFDGVTKTRARLAQVAVTPSGRATSLFTDGSVGAWQARFGLSSADYQTFFDQQVAQGLVPLRVCAKGEGSSTRFGVVFAQAEETTPRVFRANGPTTVPAVDHVMQQFLQAHNIHNAALAILDGGRLVYAKGYSWAEPGYPDVQPTTLFRQASCSKVFTAYALYRLLQQKRDAMPSGSRPTFAALLSQITLQSVLKLTQPKGQPPADPKLSSITLLDLITSTSGLDQSLIWFSQAAADAAGQPLPATRMQLARYAAAQIFNAKPGDPGNVVYGNLDYFLLAEVVRAMSGAASFEAAINTLISQPLQMTHVRGSRSLIADQMPHEALYHLTQPPPSNESFGELSAEPSLRTPQQPLVASQYGGFDWELLSGCGGLSVAVVDMARLIASLSVRNGNPVLKADTIDEWLANAATATATLSGPDAHGYHGWDGVKAGPPGSHVYSGAKGGSLPGTGTEAVFTTGGLSYIAMLGDQNRPGVDVDWLQPLTELTPPPEWASADLFPQFGMTSFAAQSHVLQPPPVDVELLRKRPTGRMTPPLRRPSQSEPITD